jgi:hypothetical protein
VSRAELALGAALLGLVLLASQLLSTAPPAPRSSRLSPSSPSASPTPQPAEPPVEVPSPPQPLALPPPGVEGQPLEGTLFVQLELSPDSVRLLHVEARPALPFRYRPSAGRYGLLLQGPERARASLRFDAPGLADGAQDEVTGDELRLAAAPLLLKLPHLGLPARLQVFSPSGTLLGDLELR